MYVIFFTNQGPAIQIAVPKGNSVNARFYKGKVLHTFKKYFLNRRPATGLRGVRFLHDYASSHKAAIEHEYLKQEKAVELPHPTYLPDLAPCDFSYSRGSKNTSLDENIKRAEISVRLFCLNSIPRQDYKNAFKIWIKRLKLCVSHGGDYFEGLR